MQFCLANADRGGLILNVITFGPTLPKSRQWLIGEIASD